MSDFSRLVYVDLETTGGRPTRDRITEIALILVDNGEEIERWQSLLNPETRIPEQIQQLTGITPSMVEDAPLFEDLIETVKDLMQDRVVVAHNARFDTAFLRNAFQRLGYPYRYPSVCTVKLSRKLYPQYKRHNLDSLIERFGLQSHVRHRAMGDTEVLPQLVDIMQTELGKDVVLHAMQVQQGLQSLPPNIDKSLLEEIPEEPGVYRFFGERNALLYVGKSIKLRSRVISHFSADHRNDREMQIAQQVRHIDWQVTAGEFSALMLEAELVKKQSPLFNRKLRRQKTLLTLFWEADKVGSKVDIREIQHADTLEFSNCYGLFRSKKQATDSLRELIKNHTLCSKTIGLEKGKGACFAYQLKRCKGVCCGQEQPLKHHLRVQEALRPLQLKHWPYKGKVGIREYNSDSHITAIHIIDRWCYLGKASDENELSDIQTMESITFDMDFYRLCVKQLAKTPTEQLIHLNI
jgi:DNA polymerase-3 subunit epsilon